MAPFTLREILEDNREELQLELLAGEAGLDRPVSSSRLQKPGLALAGHAELLHRDRIQVIGQTEMTVLSHLEASLRRVRLEELCRGGATGLVVAKGLPIPPELPLLADRHGVPLLRTPLQTSAVLRSLSSYLESRLAPEVQLHGSLVDVFGVGILILGKSGIGKSECALGLVEREHRLVADDVVVVRKTFPDALIGEGEDLTRDHMEIRGLGIINIKDLYGVSSIRRSKRVELVVELVEWQQGLEVERVGLDEQTYPILGMEVPFLKIPVRPGRDLALIMEVAARNFLLKSMGYHAAREVAGRLNRRLSGETWEKGKRGPDSVE